MNYFVKFWDNVVQQYGLAIKATISARSYDAIPWTVIVKIE